MDVSIEAKRRAYVGWLRTGRWPVPRGADGIELKFNPWHDPKDGRCTTAGGGSDVGGATDTSRHPTRWNTPSRSRNQPSNPITDIVAGQRSAAKALHTVAKAEFDFASGVSDGAYDTAKGSVKAALAFGKNPVSATQNDNLALAGLIDRAIAAEDMPASIQLARAANRIRHTTPTRLAISPVALLPVLRLAASPGWRQVRYRLSGKPDCRSGYGLILLPSNTDGSRRILKRSRPKTITMQRLMRGLDTHWRRQERCQAASNDW